MICSRCGSEKNVESHHIIYKSQNGDNSDANRIPLCQACHDYRHCLESNQKMLAKETQSDRIEVLQKRLEIIERENTPLLILRRGYYSYWNIYKEMLSPKIGKRKLKYIWQDYETHLGKRP